MKNKNKRLNKTCHINDVVKNAVKELETVRPKETVELFIYIDGDPEHKRKVFLN